MKSALSAFVLAGVLLAPGCVTLKPMRTPSGSPEIVVRSARPGEILEEMTAAMTERGYELVLQNERLAVFTRPCEDFDTAFFYGKGWNASADYRVTVVLTEREEPSVQILLDVEIVTEAGTPEEGRKPAPRGHPEAHALQDMLEVLVADLALRRHEELWPDEPARPSGPRVWTGEE